MTFIRKADSTLGDGWGDWGLLIVLVIAFVFLYGGGMLGSLNTDGNAPFGPTGSLKLSPPYVELAK